MAFIENGNFDYNYAHRQGVKIKLFRGNMNQYIKYLLTESDYIREQEMKNLKYLLDNIDIEATYEPSEVNLKNKMLFLKALVDIKLDKKITENTHIVEHLYEVFKNEISHDSLMENLDVMRNYMVDMASHKILTKNEIMHLSDAVSDRIQHINVYRNIDVLEDIVRTLRDPNVNPSTVVSEYKDDIYTMTEELKRIDRDKRSHEITEIDFSNREATINIIEQMNSVLRSPSNYISSGMKLMDKMLSGGFEKGRQYIFVGPSKGFKSGLLLNLAINACRFADVENLVKKRKNAIPVVVYITMENSMIETYGRIFNYFTGLKPADTNLSAEEIFEVVDRELYQKTGVQFVARYDSGRGGTTTEMLYDIYDELEDKNMEPIMFVHDYLARVNSTDPTANKDVRTRYGAVTNEFAAFAKTKNVPLVSAAQMNRLGLQHIDHYRDREEPDGLMLINRQHVGESSFILDNSDAVIALNREDYPEKGLKPRMTFKHIISRDDSDKDSGTVTYFAQDFENGFKFATDVGTNLTFGTKGSISQTMSQAQVPNPVSSLAGVGNSSSNQMSGGITNNIFATQSQNEDLAKNMDLKGI